MLRELEYGTFILGVLNILWYSTLSLLQILAAAGCSVAVILFLYTWEKTQEEVEHRSFSYMRPNGSPGMWCSLLLPVTLLAGSLQHWSACSDVYKLSSVASVTLAVVSVFSFNDIIVNKSKRKINIPRPFSPQHLFLSTFLVISGGILAKYVTQVDLYIAVSYVLVCHLVCAILQKKLVDLSSASFTYGEVMIISQSTACFIAAAIFNTLLNITGNETLDDTEEKITIFIQVCLLGLSMVFFTLTTGSLHQVPAMLYIVIAAFGTTFVIPVLWLVLAENPFIWIFSFIFDGPQKVALFVCWAISTAATILLASRFTSSDKLSLTAVRKLFHLAAVMIYVPGILVNRELMLLASGIVLGMFLAVEAARVMRVPPLCTSIDNTYSTFIDEKDLGPLVVSPIYLFVGLSLPLWIYPTSLNDISQSTMLSLLSGVLSLGIGDTVASVAGTWLGRTKWPGSKKSVEGTICSIISQIIFCLSLSSLGILPLSAVGGFRTVSAIVVSSHLEAFTTQVDNLVLPAVLYSLMVGTGS